MKDSVTLFKVKSNFAVDFVILILAEVDNLNYFVDYIIESYLSLTTLAEGLLLSLTIFM